MKHPGTIIIEKEMHDNKNTLKFLKVEHAWYRKGKDKLVPNKMQTRQGKNL